MTEARYRTMPSDNPSYSEEVADWGAIHMGIKLLPWQREFLDVALEYDEETLRPIHDVAAVLSVPRQSGKTFLMWLLISWWASKWEDQRILYVAQTRQDARQHIIGLGDNLIQHDIRVKVYRGIPERLEFETGSQVSVAAPSHSSVHGQSLDLVLLDEAWLSLSPEILQGVVPARAARPRSMMMAITTMGTESSDTWNDLRDRGRDGEDGIAYTEYSMDPSTQDIYDEDEWADWMPALGLTVAYESVRAGVKMLSPAEARRAYGNVTTTTDFDMFDMEAWNAGEDVYEQPKRGDLVLSVDANPHVPGGSCIAAAWYREDTSSWHVSVVDYQPGSTVLWIIERIADLIKQHRPLAVTVGGSTATRAVRADIEQVCKDYAIPFRMLTAGEVSAAGVLWADSLRTGELSHGQSESLSLAMEYAIPKQTEDGWRLDRKLMKVDGSPLSAAIAGVFVAVEEKALRPAAGIF